MSTIEDVVVVGSPGRTVKEHQDKHEQSEPGCCSILQQLKTGVSGGEPGCSDARADNDRGEKCAAERLGGDAPGKRCHQTVAKKVDTDSSAPGTRL